MAVGQGALVSHFSYLAVVRETALAAWATATEGLHFNSCSLRVTKETKILEAIEPSRTYGHSMQLGVVVEGDVEWNFSSRTKASSWFLINAFGGGVPSSATATGETVGSSVMTHTFNLNDFSATYSSLSINLRKGDSVGAQRFSYSGIRVNEFTLDAEIDEPIKAKVSVVGVDYTTTVNDVNSSITTIKQTPLSFVNARFSVENLFASLTSSSFWHVQSMHFGIKNNLKTDSGSRRIGSGLLNVMPAGIANLELTCKMRFDTSTAFTAMINANTLSAEFEFLGPTFTGSAIREGLKIQFPNLRIMDAGDPEIGGPDEVLTSEITFAVLRSLTTTGDFAVKGFITNTISSYA